MAYYDFMTEPFAKCIAAGLNTIDDVFPDDLKKKVIAFLASKGLGPDGKPLAKEEAKDLVDDKKEEAKDEPKEDNKEGGKKPEKPVEDEKEEEPSKDTDKEDKSPVEEDKGAK